MHRVMPKVESLAGCDVLAKRPGGFHKGHLSLLVEEKIQHLQHACTTYDPPNFFVRPARTSSIVRNVAKGRPRISTCRSQNFFHATTKSLHRNETDFCGPQQIYVDNLALRAFRVVQA